MTTVRDCPLTNGAFAPPLEVVLVFHFQRFIFSRLFPALFLTPLMRTLFSACTARTPCYCFYLQ
jgi:hypothetical protein